MQQKYDRLKTWKHLILFIGKKTKNLTCSTKSENANNLSANKIRKVPVVIIPNMVSNVRNSSSRTATGILNLFLAF